MLCNEKKKKKKDEIIFENLAKRSFFNMLRYHKKIPILTLTVIKIGSLSLDIDQDLDVKSNQCEISD